MYASADMQPRQRGDQDQVTTQEPWEVKLASRVMQYVAMSDSGEEARRKTDRIGANLYYGRHWNINMPKSRAALTANVTKSLIEHIISIQTKQDPIPVVEAIEWSDPITIRLMRSVLMQWWINDGMKLKIRRAQRLCKSTRTCAIKYVWDHELHGGAGDVTGDLVPGWRLILDDRATEINRMRFLGHREVMPRSRAALFYPESAEKIYSGPNWTGRSGAGAPGTPISDPWRKLMQSPNTSTLVNGNPVISAFTNQPARSTAEIEEMVQLVELFHKDDTMVEKEEDVLDTRGQPRRTQVKGKDGLPLFEMGPGEVHHLEDGTMVTLPTPKLVFAPVKHIVLKRKYPFWRRTTLLLPDGALLDDIPWDGPPPYTLFSDGQALEGPWVKGSALDGEDLQVTLNVSLSLMMDNLRMNSLRPIMAGQASNIEKNSLLVSPGEVVRVGNVDQIKPFEFPQLADPWFNWCNFIIAQMERIFGATGIMQGEAAGRVDSAAGYDTLAEIGGSRMVEGTQQMETSIADGMAIVGWYAQKYYTEAHAIAVEDSETGTTSFERVSSQYLYGTFNYRIVTGSTLAWSESAVRQRLLTELQNGLIDKIAYWQRTNTPDWQAIRDRLLTQNPILSGAAASPPPRTRTSPKKAVGQK